MQVGDTDPTLLSKGMQVIIDESGRLTGIVEELLDFSRMQNGKLSMRMEKIDVLAELDDAVFVFRERALREGIELIYNAVSYTHLRAHETRHDLVCRLLLEKKKRNRNK